MLLNRSRNAVDVEAVGASDLLPVPMQFVDDGIALLRHGFVLGSSSGVQVIGGCSPWALHTASIVLRIAAFARCLQ